MLNTLIMDTTNVSDNYLQSGWTIYLVSILILVALYFVQRYAHYFDRKLNELGKDDSKWEGKPWPLIAGILLGTFSLLYNVFSPNDMQRNPANWHWPEWALVICFFVLFGLLVFESISHFGIRLGILRFLILAGLTVGFYFAGLLAGLLIVALLAIVVIIYFLIKWRKIMLIK